MTENDKKKVKLNPVDELIEGIKRVLDDYRSINQLDEGGNGLPLKDILSTGDSIKTGVNELFSIGDDIAGFIETKCFALEADMLEQYSINCPEQIHGLLEEFMDKLRALPDTYGIEVEDGIIGLFAHYCSAIKVAVAGMRGELKVKLSPREDKANESYRYIIYDLNGAILEQAWVINKQTAIDDATEILKDIGLTPKFEEES